MGAVIRFGFEHKKKNSYNTSKGALKGVKVYLNDDLKQRIVVMLQSTIPKLQAVYLFGSQQDGTATQESDIDIAYLSSRRLSNPERWEISQKLAAIFSCDVDLVDLSAANTIFRYQILSTGERIYGSGYEVESFETLAYSFYLRFQEERKPIVDAIMEKRSVLGNNTYA